MARPPKKTGAPPAEDPGAEPKNDEIANAAQALHDSQKDEHQIERTEEVVVEPEVEAHAGDLPEEEDDTVAMERALARLGESIDRMEMSGGSLVVDMRDKVLELLKSHPKGWGHMSQGARRDAANMIEQIVQKTIKEASGIIAAMDRPSIRAVMGNITIGDKVEAKFKLAALPEDQMADTLARLYHLKGKAVMIISADDQGFYHAKRPAVEPDEPGLPFSQDADGDREEGGEGSDADNAGEEVEEEEDDGNGQAASEDVAGDGEASADADQSRD